MNGWWSGRKSNLLIYVPWLRVNLDKTEVHWVGQQNKDPDIRREEKKRDTARQLCMYLAGAVCGIAARRQEFVG